MLIMWLWHLLCDTFLYFLCIVSPREKKKKRNINNDLAILPSHNTKCSSSSAPEPDHISWRHLKSLISYNTYLERLVHITNTYINLKYWPSHFKSANTVVIPKPNKVLHNTPSSFWPIVLLNTTGKLVEKIISNWLQFHISANGFLDPNQLGGIRQRSTTDAGIYLTHLICAGWIKQCHTSVIVFDIAQFFPSLNHDFLSTCLKKARLNTNVIISQANFLQKITFDTLYTNRFLIGICSMLYDGK